MKKLPKLIINFDINKTLILCDSSKNQSFESSLLALISFNSWGKINEKNEFVLTEDELSFKCPKEGLIKYYDFIKIKLPKKNKKEIPNTEERVKYNNEIKKKRIELSDNFLNEDQPGFKLKKKYEEILKKLRISNEIKEKINNNLVPNVFKELYKNNYHFVFLSLFFTMIKLFEDGRDFSIIFRSYGLDTILVSEEFNEFCKGNHPLFDDKIFKKYYFDGTHNSKNYLINDDNKGVFYRFSSDLNDIYLNFGCLERNVEKMEKFIKNNEKNDKILKGGLNIYNFLMRKLMKYEFNSFIFNDDYKIWFSNDEKKNYSKILMLNPFDFNVHHIFFDDNIKYNEFKSIVDCRNIINEEELNDDFIRNKFIIKCDCLNAATNNEYFYNKIKEAENLRKKDLKKINYENDKFKKLDEIINEAKENFFYYNSNEFSLDEFIIKYIQSNKYKL